MQLKTNKSCQELENDRKLSSSYKINIDITKNTNLNKKRRVDHVA